MPAVTCVVLDAAVGESSVPRMLDTFVGAPRAWAREEASTESWSLEISSDARAEILALVRRVREAPLPLLLLHPDQFRLTACRALMSNVERRLTDGIGMTVVRGLPIDEMTADEARAVFWVLGHLLAPPVATRWDGTMLYDVTDTGRAFGESVRGSATNVELSFHTDNAFGVAPPDFVGLLCLQTAAHGGVSRFRSLAAVHNAMLRNDPALLRRLYEPCYYDRQAEHAPGAAPLIFAPLFRYDGRRLEARVTPNLIRRGYAIAGIAMDSPLVEALNRLETLLADERGWIELRMKPGELQYLDNHLCAHYRSAFVDGGDLATTRHLVRGWYRRYGGPNYDG